MAEDTVNHGSLPITSSFPAVANVFVMLDGDRAVSATHALAAALIEPYQDRDPGDQVYRDLASVATELARTPSTEPDRDAYVKLALAVLTTAVARGATSPAVLGPLADAIDDRLASDLGLTNERWRIPEPSIGLDQGPTAEAD